MSGRRRYDRALLAETAEVCVAAHGVQRHARAVAERFGLTVRAARHQINAAMLAGFEVPVEVVHTNHVSVRPRLVCGCGWSCPTDNGLRGLQAHTLVEHSRFPSTVERTPRLLERAA